MTNAATIDKGQERCYISFLRLVMPRLDDGLAKEDKP